MGSLGKLMKHHAHISINVSQNINLEGPHIASGFSLFAVQKMIPEAIFLVRLGTSSFLGKNMVHCSFPILFLSSWERARSQHD